MAERCNRCCCQSGWVSGEGWGLAASAIHGSTSKTCWRADGAWNFTAPEHPTQLEFTRAAAAELHRPCVFPTPAWPVRLLLGEQADLLLEGAAVAPTRLLATGFAFRYPTVRQALADLV